MKSCKWFALGFHHSPLQRITAQQGSHVLIDAPRNTALSEHKTVKSKPGPIRQSLGRTQKRPDTLRSKRRPTDPDYYDGGSGSGASATPGGGDDEDYNNLEDLGDADYYDTEELPGGVASPGKEGNGKQQILLFRAALLKVKGAEEEIGDDPRPDWTWRLTTAAFTALPGRQSLTPSRFK